MPNRAGVPGDVLDKIATDAAREAGGVPAELLGDFLLTLTVAVARGEPIPPTELRSHRALGERAARRGVALRALLDLYLSAARQLWPHLPAVTEGRPAKIAIAGEIMLQAAEDVVAVLTEAYQLARRSLVRAQESARREFIDDLLGGAADVVGVLHRANGFGLDLSGPHAVATVTAERDFDDGNPLIATLERAIRGIKGDAPPLLASKQGRLVVVFAAPDHAATEHVVDRLGATLTAAHRNRSSVGDWRIGLGRVAAGADGVLLSYRESLDALDLAERLGLAARVVDGRDLRVYRMLLRDRAALADLVESTLGGLRDARGGAGPLLDTLAAWFTAGGNTAAAARALHLSVRAVTYRLDRIRDLTDLDPDTADERFLLQVAALGAQLLGWPTGDSGA